MNLATIGFNLFTAHITKEWETGLIKECEELLRLHGGKSAGRGGRDAIARFGYDYTEETKWTNDIPALLLVQNPRLSTNSITINRYQPGSQIAPHIDAKWFDDCIYILSLGQSCEFTLSKDKALKIQQKIPPRSLILLTGEVRWHWKHSAKLDREATGPRYSIVYRNRVDL